MGKLLFIVFGLILIIVWMVLLIPQYDALKNKHYRTVLIFMIAFVLAVSSLIAMLVYGGFFNLLHGGGLPQVSAKKEFILCLLGLITVPAHFFCLRYVYFRKTWDYMRLNGHSDKEIRAMIDPEVKRWLGLPQ